MEVTVRTKIRDESLYPALDAITDHMAHAERHLFVDRYVHRRSLTALKREYLVRFGLTARQFNAIARDLAGRVSSSRKSMIRQERRLVRRIDHLRQYIARLKKCIARETSRDRKGKLRFILHQKNRHLYVLEDRLAACR